MRKTHDNKEKITLTADELQTKANKFCFPDQSIKCSVCAYVIYIICRIYDAYFILHILHRIIIVCSI